jgi:hypothetical protein
MGRGESNRTEFIGWLLRNARQTPAWKTDTRAPHVRAQARGGEAEAVRDFGNRVVALLYEFEDRRQACR